MLTHFVPWHSITVVIFIITFHTKFSRVLQCLRFPCSIIVLRSQPAATHDCWSPSVALLHWHATSQPFWYCSALGSASCGDRRGCISWRQSYARRQNKTLLGLRCRTETSRSFSDTVKLINDSPLERSELFLFVSYTRYSTEAKAPK